MKKLLILFWSILLIGQAQAQNGGTVASPTQWGVVKYDPNSFTTVGGILKVVGGGNATVTPTIQSPTFSSMTATLAGTSVPLNIIVAADETTLNNAGNPQRVTYWYDGQVLYYPALARATGTQTTAGRDNTMGTDVVANNAALLAYPTVYRPTLIQVSTDSNNSNQVGYYLLQTDGSLIQFATYKVR